MGFPYRTAAVEIKAVSTRRIRFQFVGSLSQISLLILCLTMIAVAIKLHVKSTNIEAQSLPAVYLSLYETKIPADPNF